VQILLSSEHQRKKKKKSSKRKSKKSRKERLKPIEPRTYNGSANTTEFSRFAQEVLDFIKTGRVHRRRQIFMTSRYLTGKAYKLYEQKYAMNPSKHDIRTFFRDLFNHCFPPHFRSTLHERLFRCTQGNCRVRDYVHELIELFTLLGEDNERTQVIHLWDGLRANIREALLTQRYHKETSSWDEVVDMAEILEIAFEESSKERSNRYRETCFGESNRRSSDYFHNKRADNHRSNPQNEQNKNNNIPQNRRDYSPTPAPKTNDECGREHFGKSKGPARKWEKKSNNRPKPWGEQQLSKKEREEHISEGRCFRCHQQGHMARQCPEGNSMRSDNKGPPGQSNPNRNNGNSSGNNNRTGPSNSYSSAGVNIDLVELDKRNKLASTTQEVNSLHFGGISFDFPSEPPPSAPSFTSMQPIRDFDEEIQRVPLGNLLAQDAMDILNENQPYPGDPETPPDGCGYHD
jgi:hypothetical protein